jgi:Protein of unknown function (DUF3043)
VFKRRSSTIETPEETAAALAGKGRPTPSRKEAEAARAARVKPPKDSKEAKRLERQRTLEARAAARKGMNAGDARYLPARDRGPERLWVRQLVDSRWSPGELILPAAAIVFVISLLSPIAFVLFYVLIVFVIFDSVVLARRITQGITANFPDVPVKGLRMYGILRASQIRRMRTPKAQGRRRTLTFRRPPHED